MENRYLEKWAKVLVHYSLRLQKGDLLRIGGTTLTAPLILAVYREALEVGAHPYTRVAIEGIEETYYRYASEEQLRFVSEVEKFEMEKVDAYLTILGYWNTRSLSNIDPARLAIRQEATRDLSQRFLERSAKGELRWCVTQFPTNADAQEADMSLRDYEEFIIRACLLEHDDPITAWEQVKARQDRIARFLEKIRTFRIVAPDVDLTISTEGRRWINAFGDKNFPDGEVFTGPVEDSANGHVRFTFPAIFHGREVIDVRLWFESGRVVKAEASKGEELLHSMLDTDPGARYVGEFAFGLNDGIQRFTKNILFDEKIGGTFHLALGSGYPETGSRNISGLHWDMICDLRRGGEVYGDGELIYRDGRFLIA
ncbi:MAG: aminopeptidase [Armatimonadota bacterium]|nr:aminopeptidase [Armatimonadota bacterium]MDR5701990.1 aminopeptidase [Armatimonadota bacterium]MDR7434712.1 aminopeptidase [Armatimonadota bacterium]